MITPKYQEIRKEVLYINEHSVRQKSQRINGKILKVDTKWLKGKSVPSEYKYLDHSKPYFLRIVKTVVYMLYLIHLNACAYYWISWWEGLGTNGFVYDNVGNAYIRCFFFATKVQKRAKQTDFLPSYDIKLVVFKTIWGLLNCYHALGMNIYQTH